MTEGDGTYEELTPDLWPMTVIETERRLKRNTYLIIVIGVVVALAISGWRMALGVLLGGALSLLNVRWLHASVGAILQFASNTGNPAVPKWTVSKFFVRYGLIAAVMIFAIGSGWFELLGVGLGFAAFVGAAMIEAAYQAYLTFTRGA